MSDFLLLPFDILVDQLLSPADDFLSPTNVLAALLGDAQPDVIGTSALYNYYVGRPTLQEL